MTSKRSFVALVLAASGLLALAADVAARDCRAEVEAELTREESGEETGGKGMRYTFTVDVRAEADCAVVHFELLAKIQKSDGSDEERTEPGQVRLSNGSISHEMHYTVPPEEELLHWEVRQTKCEPCGLDEDD